ncbi:60S ribosomal protein L35 [Pseudozyma hubeiensis SY62]|uniref:60S ribosomal protein L35 n=1 Tax=Pseudozyma hubeiensis (strain SY62) TaxID=1305764 RepID=R9PDQ1_PSEHS|nr:60S ribosomal protein L35 [Pseudozyma hubeiensis SY62]GAC99513.1 60S ribosomal protein L35 [Pseudozyma hubeiensis SY62]
MFRVGRKIHQVCPQPEVKQRHLQTLSTQTSCRDNFYWILCEGSPNSMPCVDLTPSLQEVVVKTFELQSKSKTDLTKQLEELKTELLNLRVQKVAGGSSSKILRINSLRKDIARVLTVMNQKQRANLREFYKGKSQIPLDLRAKKTRAIRRKLNQHERTRITERQHKREIHFANRKYVLKA